MVFVSAKLYRQSLPYRQPPAFISRDLIHLFKWEVVAIKDLKIGFIGAGKVGFSLGKLFQTGGIHVTGYFSRHGESAKEAAKFTDSEFYDDMGRLLSESDALFLTVPDGEITSVFEKLVSYGKDNKVPAGKMICHCSGALTSTEAFPGIDEISAIGFSLHPLFPVSDKYKSYEGLKDAFFCIEGDERFLPVWENIFSEMGIRTLKISSSDKVKYHMACATASNLVCAVLDRAVTMFRECGFSESQALNALKPLIMSNVESVIKRGTESALTGPAERGDAGTIKKHLDCLKDRDNEEDIKLYASATRTAVDIASRKNPGRDYSDITDMLSNY